jgi:hypothetical protein
MKRNVLPVTMPTITTATGYADALAILQSNSSAFDWIYSHYIQIFALQTMPKNTKKDYWHLSGHTESFFCDFDQRRIGNTTNDGIMFDRERCPYLNIFEIPHEFIKYNNGDYVSFIKYCIDNRMYIYAIIDTSKVKAYKSPYPSHPVLIYGYDDDLFEFYFCDFLDFSTFGFNSLTYSEAETAFKNSVNTEFPLVKSIAAIRFVNNASFEFNMGYVRDSIKDYIMPDKTTAERFAKYATSHFTVLNWQANAFLGVDFYDFLSEFFRIELELNMYPSDIIPFHALYDHKEMMCKRLEYFFDKEYINQNKRQYAFEFEKEVRDKAVIIRNMILKFNLKRDNTVKDKLNSLLAETRAKEIELLKNIFDI